MTAPSNTLPVATRAHSENPLRAEFWLGVVDPRPLALFRIGLGLLVLQDLVASYIPDATALLTDQGMLPRGALEVPRTWSLFNFVGSPAGVTALLAAGVLVLLGFVLGFYTRLMTVACWVFLTSLHNRNLFFTDGGDDLVRYLFFYCIFSDVAGAWSLDVRLGRRPSGPVPALGLRFLQAHFALLYFVTARLKFRFGWMHKNAIHQTLHLSGFVRPPGQLLLAHPALCRLLTFNVAFLECSFPFLAFWPWLIRWTRPLAIVCAVLVQGGILLTMRVGIFTGVMLWANVLWLQPEWLDGIAGKMGRKPSPPLGFEPAETPGAVVRQLPWRQGAALALLAAVFVSEAWGPFIGSHVAMPGPVWKARNWLSLNQPFDLFGTTYDVPHYRVLAALSDGRVVDIMPVVAPGMEGAAGWRFSRWYKFLFKDREHPFEFEHLASWMTRDYERRSGNYVTSLSIQRAWTPALSAPPPPTWRELWRTPPVPRERASE